MSAEIFIHEFYVAGHDLVAVPVFSVVFRRFVENGIAGFVEKYVHELGDELRLEIIVIFVDEILEIIVYVHAHSHLFLRNLKQGVDVHYPVKIKSYDSV